MNNRARELPPIVRIKRVQEIRVELGLHGVPLGRPVVVIVGGAGGMDEDGILALNRVLRKVILPIVQDRAAAVVDGGTDSGVMRAVGRARDVTGGGYPLVGVAADGTVLLPGRVAGIEDAAELEPHHTLIVLVPGRAWGDESPWIAHVAGVIAAGSPSVTLLANGGEIAFNDIYHSLEQRRPVIVLAGTGRTADTIADARRGSHTDPRADRIASSTLTSIVPIHDIDAVRTAVEAALTRPTGSTP